MKNGDDWNGMSEFSIHNSQARSHVSEWLMHEIFRREGIITPKYDFIEVESNGKDLGVYAYEQHFEDQMLLDNGRQTGPILRHNDEAYWSNVQKNLDDFSWVRSAEVESMNSSGRQRQLHLAGRTMLNAFLQGEKRAGEVFDLDLMARYFALLNLSHANHAQLITNIRFYLDPYTGLLEPIAYDCFGSDLPPVTRDWTSIGEGMNRGAGYAKLYEEGYVYEVELFKDDEFYERFLYYSYHYTSPTYMDTLKSEFDDAIFARRNFIRADPKYANYNFSWETFTRKGRFTHDKLLPKPYLSLKPYYTNDERTSVYLECFHYFPVEILGFGNEVIEYELDEPVILEAFNDRVPPDSKIVGLEQSARYVYFRTLGIDSVFREKISTQIQSDPTLDFVLYDIKRLRDHDFLDINDKVISFKSGEYEITSMISIPESYTVQVPAGTSITFQGNGALISKSPVLAIGSREQPIKFIGQKNRSNGISIVDAPGKSEFHHCLFTGLSGISQANVQTEGALVVYQSSILVQACEFVEIKARDGLKLVNSSGKVDNTRFINCQGDGIDMDRSALDLYTVEMEQIGQDAIEVDGGNLLASDVTIAHCLQYGMRIRNRAKAAVYSLNIRASEHGLIAGSGARVDLFNPQFNGLQNGFVVESDEIERTAVHAMNLVYEDVLSLYLMDSFSELTINDSKKRPL